ncbi:MAG: hypothetical protein MUC34_08715 [Anaerolineae bacterium]|nr:hypothetical protein [Anaerolineae bacterium]
MSGEARVLNGLLQRRALDEAFAELSRTTDPVVVQQRAEAIAAYGSAALHHLISLLDTPDPQLRGGLGQVARHLPREQVVPALRAVARGHERSDQARLAAVTLLERFLGEPIDDAMIAGLRNPDAAARQSLAELIAAMDDEPLSVVEYLEQLGQQPAEVVDMVLDALPAVEPSPHLATLLRMLAQGEDARIARRALDELARMRSPAALRGLASLAPNLPPSLSPSAERSLRKMRFSGVAERADHDPRREPWYAPGLRWRTLMSPVDLLGSQLLWFIGEDESENRTVFFTVLIHDPGGLRDASGSLDAHGDHVPQRRRVGYAHSVAGDGDAPGLTLLEAPPPLACRALRRALALNWEAGATTPVGYRLFSPLIWLSDEAEGAHDFDEDEIAAPPALDEFGVADAAALFGHPAFAGWLEALRLAPVDAESLASFARRLDAMARWLNVAGDVWAAQAAETLAQRLGAAQSDPDALAEMISFLEAAAGRRRESQDQSKENRNV